MNIETIQKYRFKGKEFNTLKDIQDEIHNNIGIEVLDEINRKCEIKHKDLFKMLEILCSPKVRETLLGCLDVTITIEGDEYTDNETKNILDFNFGKKNPYNNFN